MNLAPPAPDLGTLPALKTLGKLADLRPTIVVDSREQDPLVFTRLASVPGGLRSGDYSFEGGQETFAVERKSLADLVSCCTGENRLRLERELHRLRGFHFARLLIVGPRWMIEGHRYRSAIKPAAVLHSLAAWEVRYRVPVVWADTPEAAALLVESWAWWTAREMVETANTLLRGSKAAPAAPAVEPIKEKAKAPTGEGWSTVMPDSAGQWQMASDETDFEAETVKVFDNEGELWVSAPDTGLIRLDHYHTSLIELRWRKSV